MLSSANASKSEKGLKKSRSLGVTKRYKKRPSPVNKKAIKGRKYHNKLRVTRYLSLKVTGKKKGELMRVKETNFESLTNE